VAPFRAEVSPVTVRAIPPAANVQPVPLGITRADESWISGIGDAAKAPLELTLRGTQRLLGDVSPDIYRGLSLLLLATSLAAIAGFALSYERTKTRVRRSRSLNIDGTDVRVSPSIGPAVVGLVPSHIVVPEWLMSRPVQDQRIAVAHEVEHIRGGDPWMLVIACAAVSLMPWNPALWYCLSRLRLAMEVDCDRRVLGRGVPAVKYGSLLIDFSAMHSTSPMAIPAFPGSGSHLERRLIAMTERPVKTLIPRTIAACFVAAMVLITACESQLPSAADIEQMDVSTAQRYAKTQSAATAYLVDGKKVDAQTATALKPGEIATINMTRDSLSAADEIRIVTLKEAKRTALTNQMMQSSRAVAQLAPTMRMKVSADKIGFTGLLVIDGAIVNSSALATLSPDRIASMEVMKAAAAVGKYSDPRAANGVIIVTTKK
jgi:hypothetical protein